MSYRIILHFELCKWPFMLRCFILVFSPSNMSMMNKYIYCINKCISYKSESCLPNPCHLAPSRIPRDQNLPFEKHWPGANQSKHSSCKSRAKIQFCLHLAELKGVISRKSQGLEKEMAWNKPKDLMFKNWGTLRELPAIINCMIEKESSVSVTGQAKILFRVNITKYIFLCRHSTVYNAAMRTQTIRFL